MTAIDTTARLRDGTVSRGAGFRDRIRFSLRFDPAEADVDDMVGTIDGTFRLDPADGSEVLIFEGSIKVSDSTKLQQFLRGYDVTEFRRDVLDVDPRTPWYQLQSR